MIYLIRHASAAERGPSYPDDSLRPLTRKGQEQAESLARALKRMDVSFDRLFSSPYTRAAQTAESVAARLKKGCRIQYLDALTDDDYPQLLTDLGDGVKAGDETVALVGHEPFLSELASFLLTGEPQGVSVQVKKAALLALGGALAPGEMTLHLLLPAAVYRHLQP